MGLIEPGRIWMPTGAPELRDLFLRDVENAARERGIENPPVHPGTDWYVLGTALGNIGLIQMHNLRLMETNADVLLASGAALDEKRVAEGLPEVPAAPAIGKLVAAVQGGGTVTIADGQQFTYPNGLRGKAVGTHLGIADGDLVSVIAIDTGNETNLSAGQKVTWVSPPLNLDPKAKVSAASPLRGGVDEETDARKRARILNRRQNPPQGGNPGQLIETALNALASVQYAFVYPALGGPSSAKVVAVRDIDPPNNDFSRVMPAGGLQIVRDAIQRLMPDGQEIVVATAAEESVSVTVKLDIPDAVSAGGSGLGWLDASPWPALVVADGGVVTVTSVTSSSVIVVSANTTSTPTAGQTHVCWWNETDQRFEERLVVSASGAPGTWTLTLDAPLVDSQGGTVSAGDYISPAAVSASAYGATWRDAMRTLGPGENTSDANRLPRSLRQPEVDQSWHSSLGFRQLRAMSEAHSEIQDIEYGYSPTTSPSVPASVATNPNVLKLQRFGIYPL